MGYTKTDTKTDTKTNKTEQNRRHRSVQIIPVNHAYYTQQIPATPSFHSTLSLYVNFVPQRTNIFYIFIKNLRCCSSKLNHFAPH